MTKKATPTKGPEKWYEGYPNLIWYSLEYGNRQIKDFKELDDRRFELDKELQKLVYSKEAVKILANFIHSFELDNQFDKRLVNELHELVGKIADKVENRLSVVALDLEFISAACDEWKKRENWEPIVEESV